MIFALTYRIDTSSSQKAVALRDKLADVLEEDEDVTVIGSSSAQEGQTFEVVGVDVATREPFTETVEAEHADEAKASVESEDKVVDVRQQD